MTVLHDDGGGHVAMENSVPSPVLHTYVSEKGMEITLTHNRVSYTTDLAVPSLEEHDIQMRPSVRTSMSQQELHALARAQGYTLVCYAPEPEGSRGKLSWHELWAAGPLIAFTVEYTGNPAQPETLMTHVNSQMSGILKQEWRDKAMKNTLMPHRSSTLTRNGRMVTTFSSHEALCVILASARVLHSFNEDRSLAEGETFTSGITRIYEQPNVPPLCWALKTALLATESFPFFSKGLYGDRPLGSMETFGETHTIQEVVALRELCVKDNHIRRMMGCDPSLLRQSEIHYEKWIVWINNHTAEQEDRPIPFAPLSLRPMLSLPSLLASACADPDVQYKLIGVIGSLNDAALREWWCMPDALGKTGAQWCLTGIWGHGDMPRAKERFEVAREILKKAPATVWAQRSLLLGTYGDRERKAVQERLAWGKDLLATVYARLGATPEAWVTEAWTPAGLWIEALQTRETCAPVFSSQPEAWGEALTHAAWSAPLTITLFVTEEEVSSMQNKGWQETFEAIQVRITCAPDMSCDDLVGVLQDDPETPVDKALEGLVSVAPLAKQCLKKGTFSTRHKAPPLNQALSYLQHMLAFQQRVWVERDLRAAFEKTEGEKGEIKALKRTQRQRV